MSIVAQKAIKSSNTPEPTREKNCCAIPVIPLMLIDVILSMTMHGFTDPENNKARNANKQNYS